jgi:hypothetical protein
MRTLEVSKFCASQCLVAMRERRNHAEVQVERLRRLQGDDPPPTWDRLNYWRGVVESANEAIDEIRAVWGQG